jgi:hypothetical protein
MLGMAQYEAAMRGVELDSVEKLLNGIVSDYKRIIREYDAVTTSKEADYDAHQTVTSFLESIASEAPNSLDLRLIPLTQVALNIVSQALDRVTARG